jgi:hypothetical protein
MLKLKLFYRTVKYRSGQVESVRENGSTHACFCMSNCVELRITFSGDLDANWRRAGREEKFPGRKVWIEELV